MAKKNYNLIMGLSALVAIVLIISFVGYWVSKPKPHVIQGEVEASDYRISCMVPGHVTELYCREGQQVRKGDTVAFIDSPQVRAKLAQAQAARSAAMAQSNKASNGARREQIAGAYELWQQALVQEDVMKRSLERMQKLYDQKVVAAQKYDEVKARYEASAAQARAAKSQYDMALAGARAEDKEAANAQVARVDGILKELAAAEAERYLLSPCDGEVSEIFPKVGELVGQGSPVMAIVDMTDVWFTFSVREDMLEGFRKGSQIDIRIPALGEDKSFPVVVTNVKAMGTYATWRTTKQNGGYDVRTFDVKCRPVTQIEGLRPGMTALIMESEK
jgi:HlyD family secretion protein